MDQLYGHHLKLVRNGLFWCPTLPSPVSWVCLTVWHSLSLYHLDILVSTICCPWIWLTSRYQRVVCWACQLRADPGAEMTHQGNVTEWVASWPLQVTSLCVMCCLWISALTPCYPLPQITVWRYTKQWACLLSHSGAYFPPSDLDYKAPREFGRAETVSLHSAGQTAVRSSSSF